MSESEGWSPSEENAREVERFVCPGVDFDRVIFVNGRRMSVREYNNTHGWATNGERCVFCGNLLHVGSNGYHCFACSPEDERIKLIKSMRKKVKMEVTIK